MRPATKRLLGVAFLLLAVWAVSSAVALAAGWPARFDEGHGDTNDLAQAFLNWGTAVSPPRGVMIALAVFALLASLRGFWGALGIGGLCYLSVALLLSGIAELVDRGRAERRIPRPS